MTLVTIQITVQEGNRDEILIPQPNAMTVGNNIVFCYHNKFHYSGLLDEGNLTEQEINAVVGRLRLRFGWSEM